MPGDPHRLHQVVWNLLSNAVKFTPRGGEVVLHTGLDDEGVFVRVTDTGEGLPPEFLPFVFERFRQADASAARRHGGLGLGLAISRQLVELHGGAIAAESDGVGQGSTFTVHLPLAPVRQAQAVATDTLASSAPPGQPPRDLVHVDLDGVDVLVVDDQVDALELCARVLTEAGARVRQAASADVALRELAARRPDVIVSDIGMPQMDGYSLLRHIRGSLALPAADLPAVAMSAFSRAEDRANALHAGYQDFLVKPLDLRMLVASVASMVRRPVSME